MKRISIVLIVLIIGCQFSYAQVTSGVVKYTKRFVTPENTTNKPSFIIKRFEELAPEFEKLRFELKFSEGKSTFALVQTLETEERASKFAANMGGGRGVYYQEGNIRLHQKDVFGGLFVVKGQVSDIQWELHNETKQVGRYLCYKASTIYTVVNRKGTFHHPVVVWYTPQIPVSFGPIGYGGLPGLIVELNVQNMKFEMLKISMDPATKVHVKKPIKGKLVTEKELSEIAREAMGNFGR